MIKRLIYDLIHIVPQPISAHRLRLGLIWGSLEDTRVEMEKVIYKSLCITLLYPPQRSCRGYTGFIMSVRLSVRPSVRPSVDKSYVVR